MVHQLLRGGRACASAYVDADRDGRGQGTHQRMEGVRERLDKQRFWWRAAERERPRVPVRAPTRPAFSASDLAALPEEIAPQTSTPRHRRFWMASSFAAALLLGGAAFLAVSRFGTLPASAPVSAHIDELMIMAGLGVEEVHIAGHAYTDDREIFAALELGRPTSLLRYNPEAARRRVEALSWVRRATVARVLPNAVEVRIAERTPIAVWLRGNSASLVDAEGRELARVAPSTQQALPRISGAGAPEAASSLIAALREHPSLAARVLVSERFGQRRWSLNLDNGSRIHLPAEGETAALARLMKLADSARLLNEPGRVVDLRIEDRIAVAPRQAAPASSAAAAPASPAVPRKSASAL
jgi:cell division protein FtsQ